MDKTENTFEIWEKRKIKKKFNSGFYKWRKRKRYEMDEVKTELWLENRIGHPVQKS